MYSVEQCSKLKNSSMKRDTFCAIFSFRFGIFIDEWPVWLTMFDRTEQRLIEWETYLWWMAWPSVINEMRKIAENAKRKNGSFLSEKNSSSIQLFPSTFPTPFILFFCSTMNTLGLWVSQVNFKLLQLKWLDLFYLASLDAYAALQHNSARVTVCKMSARVDFYAFHSSSSCVCMAMLRLCSVINATHLCDTPHTCTWTVFLFQKCLSVIFRERTRERVSEGEEEGLRFIGSVESCSSVRVGIRWGSGS